MSRKTKRIWIIERIMLLVSVILVTAGCGRKVIELPPAAVQPPPAAGPLASMGYSVQTGAFKDIDRAIKLCTALEAYDLNAYYFLHDSGLYKVRFGNFSSRQAALAKAEAIRASKIIDEYCIISPEDYAAMKQHVYGGNYLRESIVRTAERFIGIPYKWGGFSIRDGFDCSGLAMIVYRLNGLNLPRVSIDQYMAGRHVEIKNLKKGDLVFFATSGMERVSHVGIYSGNNRFIHAPKKDSRIRVDSLSGYFLDHFVGAKTYM